MPLFTMTEPQGKGNAELHSYLTELVTYLRFLLENLDGDNIPSLDRKPPLTFTVYPEDWRGDTAPYTLTLNHSAITEKGVYALIPSPDVTAEEFEAFRSACLMGAKQSRGRLTLKAWGEKPKTDLKAELIFI